MLPTNTIDADAAFVVRTSKPTDTNTYYLQTEFGGNNECGAGNGAKGGYVLTKAPDEITVEDILKATEGSLAPVACAEDKGKCASYGDCVTSFIWTEIYKATIGVVSSITLKDLAERSLQIEKTELECLK